MDLVNSIVEDNEAAYFQIGPNPFSFETIFSFNLISLKNSSMEVRDAQGQLVSSIDSENFSLGKNEIHWFAKSNSGKYISPGIYFVSFQIK
jgi:flagellar hook assembly protein FlgD